VLLGLLSRHSGSGQNSHTLLLPLPPPPLLLLLLPAAPS
jgi:hypothetical protein